MGLRTISETKNQSTTANRHIRRANRSEKKSSTMLSVHGPPRTTTNYTQHQKDSHKRKGKKKRGREKRDVARRKKKQKTMEEKEKRETQTKEKGISTTRKTQQTPTHSHTPTHRRYAHTQRPHRGGKERHTETWRICRTNTEEKHAQNTHKNRHQTKKDRKGMEKKRKRRKGVTRERGARTKAKATFFWSPST